MSDRSGNARNRNLNRFFDLVAQPSDQSLFQRLRRRYDLTEASVHSNIDEGENPLMLWRRHYGETAKTVAEALKISVSDYRAIERNFYWSDKDEIESFCDFFKRHPVDLVSDTDVMATSVAEALIDRAHDARHLRAKREKARFAILDEIDKSVQIFAQNRLHLQLTPGREAQTPEAVAFTKLTLNHPLAGMATTFEAVQNILFDDVQSGFDFLLSEAEADLPAYYNAKHPLRMTQAKLNPMLVALWDRINAKASKRAGDMLLERLTIQKRDLQSVKREFVETPEVFGVSKWHCSHVIEGRTYDWQGANDVFFEMIGAWFSYNVVRDQLEAQRDHAQASLVRLEKWLDQGAGQDAVQAFANICLFDKAFKNDAEIQAKLAVFRPTRANAATLNGVFKIGQPC